MKRFLVSLVFVASFFSQAALADCIKTTVYECSLEIPYRAFTHNNEPAEGAIFIEQAVTLVGAKGKVISNCVNKYAHWTYKYPVNGNLVSDYSLEGCRTEISKNPEILTCSSGEIATCR